MPHARPAERLLPRLPRLLTYPLRSPMPWMLLALAVFRQLDRLPSLLGLVFAVLFWVMAFKVAVEALTNTAEGRYEPLGNNDLWATDGDAVRQLVLQVLAVVAVVLVAYFGGLWAALGAYGVMLVAMPAAVTTLAMSGSLGAALNPLTWLALMARLGGQYVAVVAVILVMSLLVGAAEWLLTAQLPGFVGRVPATMVGLYGLILTFHLLGDMIHRNRAALGLETTPAIRRAAYANPAEDDAMAEADALAVEGEFARAAERLNDMFRGRGASDPLHDRYRELLVQAGDLERLARHDGEYISALLATQKPRRALQVYVDTKARVPAFVPAHDEHVAELVAQALRTGQTSLAVQLADGFETRFPESPLLPQLVLDVAWPMVDKLGQDQAARARLQALLRTHADHALAPRARDLLAQIEKLAPAG